MTKALITGGTRGIGRAIAEKFYREGIEVTITGRSKIDSNFDFLEVDYLSPHSFTNFINKVKSLKFDILVNNAGINKISSFENIEIEDWNNILQVNLTAPFQLTQACLPNMVGNRYGRIVNVSSVFGCVSKEKRAAYSASKFGLLGLTKACAAEYAESNILVNCIGPGFIDTELTKSILSSEEIKNMVASVPMKRLGTPEEIAEIAFFLSSSKNTFLTGQLILTDGGFTSV